MKSRDRQRVCRAAVESLEGRALLSGSGAGAFKHTVATVLRTPHVHVAHAGSHGAANPSIVFLRAARRANALALRHDLSIPENVAGGQTTPTVASLSASSPSSISITSIPGRATNRAAVLNSGAALTPNIVMTAPVSHQSASVPISVGAPVVASSQPAIAVTPTTTAATATPTTTAAATATPTTTTAAASPTTATPTTATAVPTPPPAPPMQGNLLGGVTLTPTDVAGVKSAVDAFASAYTGGATPATDSAAVTAFRTAIQGVDATIFAETRVVGASSVTAFQQAVDQFAASYTSGKNAAADVAAWSSLETALGAFGKAVDAPSSTAGSSVPVANTPMTDRSAA